MIAIGTKLQIQEQRSRAGNFVDEAATDADREIEVLNVRRLHARPQGSTIAASETVVTALAARTVQKLDLVQIRHARRVPSSLVDRTPRRRRSLDSCE